jgi:hypothetical protein
VAARPKAYICGRSPAEIVDSNPAGGMEVCLLWVLCVCNKPITRPEESLPTVVRRCVISKTHEWGDYGPR